jgi:hypothetical protein
LLGNCRQNSKSEAVAPPNNLLNRHLMDPSPPSTRDRDPEPVAIRDRFPEAPHAPSSAYAGTMTLPTPPVRSTTRPGYQARDAASTPSPL